ncbi:hypothetical protein Tco_0443103 [Tanacetum coccineum]
MLKKFGLEDSKPMKTPMSSDTKLMKDEEVQSPVNSHDQPLASSSTSWRSSLGLKDISFLSTYELLTHSPSAKCSNNVCRSPQSIRSKPSGLEALYLFLTNLYNSSTSKGQEKASTDTELFIQEVTPIEVIQDQEGSEKASDEVSTVGAKKGTATEEVPIVSTVEVSFSTAGGTVIYTRRSAKKRSRQDKGKAIMIEEEPKKKSKKELEQERLSYAEAIRLEEQMNEEQRA